MSKHKEKRKKARYFKDNHLDPPLSGTSTETVSLDETPKLDMKAFGQIVTEMRKIEKQRKVQERETVWNIVKNLYLDGDLSDKEFVSDAKNIGRDNFEIIQVIKSKKK